MIPMKKMLFAAHRSARDPWCIGAGAATGRRGRWSQSRSMVGRHVHRIPIARGWPRADVGPRQQHRRSSLRQADLVHRRRLGRRLEDHQRRHHVDAGLAERGFVLGRRGRDRSEEPEHHLGRQRRSEQPAQRRLRRRHLPQRRRRPHVAQPRPQDLGAHRPHRHRPARFERRVRRRLWPAVDVGRRPRSLQDHRRRQELDEDPRDQREHRRQRRRHGSRPIRTCCWRSRISAAVTPGP